jgi:aryl-alcohol dehydrogenase-like predicted oxidoreductase
MGNFMLSTRAFGTTGKTTTTIGFGAWAIGGTWGEVTEAAAKETLHAALDAGMTFIDTADVYGDGRSERLIAEVLATRPGPRPLVATKAGRRLSPHVAEGYRDLIAFIDRSRRNLQMDRLDLLQLHCPPPMAYHDNAVFDALDDLQSRGVIARYGVSVETVAEAMAAIVRPGVASVQIIYNIFRPRPAERFFRAAERLGVAVIARVPLASGLLTGKMTAQSQFAADDHRSFNRNGEAFDMGETFSGVPFDVGLAAVDEIRALVPAGTSMAQMALRWIMMDPALSVVIPGAKTPEQARANAAADALAPLPDATMNAMRDIYDRLIAPHVHHRW